MRLSVIKPNPSNPRVIKDDKFKKLVKSITDFPKMLELRPMIVNDDMILLGGNMRLKALQHIGYTEIPDEWVRKASDLTEEEQRQFIIKDNVGYGEWDWDMLANDFEIEELGEWGLDVPNFQGVGIGDALGEEFSLPNGDKAPFQQMTFTLANEQAEQIKNAIAEIKQTEDYNHIETMGNENSNGNALHLIVMQWIQTRN